MTAMQKTPSAALRPSVVPSTASEGPSEAVAAAESEELVAGGGPAAGSPPRDSGRNGSMPVHMHMHVHVHVHVRVVRMHMYV